MKSLLSQFPEKFYIVCIEENENHLTTLSVVHLFILSKKKTSIFFVQLIQYNYPITSQKMCQNSMVEIYALYDQYFKIWVNTILLIETMMKADETMMKTYSTWVYFL